MWLHCLVSGGARAPASSLRPVEKAGRPVPARAMLGSALLRTGAYPPWLALKTKYQSLSPSFYFTIIIIINNILVIEIKFVLGVQLSLWVPSPVCSVETSGRPGWPVSSEVWGTVSRTRLSLGLLGPWQIPHELLLRGGQTFQVSPVFSCVGPKGTDRLLSSGEDLGWGRGCL